MTTRYRRSPSLVLFWSPNGFAYFDCASGTRRTAPATMVPLLDAMEDWQSPDSFAAEHPEVGSEAEVADLFVRLAALNLVESESPTPTQWRWSDWMPEAAFFHFGTRDAIYPTDILNHELMLVEKATTIPQPRPTKTSIGARIALPSAVDIGPLGHVLRARRTWRQFENAPIELAELSTILSLTWGVHRRGRVEGQGDVVFKTSPSGGARHPIEAYVLALGVTDLPPAWYHYDSLTHELVRVGGAMNRDAFVELLGNQFYFSRCAAAIAMTACFERTMWRYPYSRAYRSVLIEAGHLAQTFALVSTAMELAPFQTIAFNDTPLEAAIGVNGAEESAIYMVGVGRRNLDALDHPGRIHPREQR